MKAIWGKAIQTQTFPTYKAWRAFAQDAGLCHGFFCPQGISVPCQSVGIYVDYLGTDLRALVVLFNQSREIGLWVAQDARRQGFGTNLFLNAVKTQTQAPLFSIVAVSNPYRVAMSSILGRAGFSLYLSAGDKVVWYRRAEDPSSGPAPASRPPTC